MLPVVVQYRMKDRAGEMSADIREQIRKHALQEGFDACGFAAADADARDMAALQAFVGKGWHGDMAWLARPRPELSGENPEHNPSGNPRGNPRGDPRALMDGAKTAIVLGLNYGPEGDPLAVLAEEGRGGIAAYARAGRDYHDVVKKKLKRLARWMVEQFDGPDVKVFVDTAPLMEKPLAARAGLGWQGKHTNLVSREFGSWLFLGEILTTLDIPPDLPEADHCGSCRACMNACPTDAIPEPYRLEATRCVSYLTIEHKGMIAPELMAAMGTRVYGCDDCIAVCPWNKFATPAAEPAFAPRPELTAPVLAQLARLDDAAFRALFQGSAIKRSGRARFVRNVLIAIGNGADADSRDVVEMLTGDEDALVRETAHWALARLDGSAGEGNHSTPDVTHEERQKRQ